MSLLKLQFYLRLHNFFHIFPLKNVMLRPRLTSSPPLILHLTLSFLTLPLPLRVPLSLGKYTCTELYFGALPRGPVRISSRSGLQFEEPGAQSQIEDWPEEQDQPPVLSPMTSAPPQLTTEQSPEMPHLNPKVQPMGIVGESGVTTNVTCSGAPNRATVFSPLPFHLSYSALNPATTSEAPLSVIDFCTNRQRACDFLLVNNANLHHISHFSSYCGLDWVEKFSL